MDFRRNSQHRLCAGGLLGRRTQFFGSGQIVFDGSMEAGLKLQNQLTMEGDDVVSVHDTPNDDLARCVVDHACRVALVGQSGSKALRLLAGVVRRGYSA